MNAIKLNMTPKLAPRATLFTLLPELECESSLPVLEMPFPAMEADEEGEIDSVDAEEGELEPSDEDKGGCVLVPDPAGIEAVESPMIPSVETLDSEEEEPWLVRVCVGDGEAEGVGSLDHGNS
jgi:hypothetical protein